MRALILAICLFEVGCQSNTSFYFGGKGDQNIKNAGYAFHLPSTWRFLTPIEISESRATKGVAVFIDHYEWSPTLQVDRIAPALSQNDLHVSDAFLLRYSKLLESTHEALSKLGGYTGMGLRRTGKSGKYDFEYVIFYPDGKLAGTRFLIITAGTPNARAREELAFVMDHIDYSSSGN